MYLVDTSVWISLFSPKPKWKIKPELLFQFAICPPVIQELLQGFGDEKRYAEFKQNLLALPRYGDPIPTATYIKAGEIYRIGRRKGITIRSSVDCLIATIAMDNNLTVWHRDRDFKNIARYTALVQTESIPVPRKN